jgi:hypothetical protein
VKNDNKRDKLVLTYTDFQKALEIAKYKFANIGFPIMALDKAGSKVVLDARESANYCLFEAVIDFLESKQQFQSEIVTSRIKEDKDNGKKEE